jgi:predicted transposase YbfD/YdcC
MEIESFEVIFSNMEDPRIHRTKLYPLCEIMFLILCGAICGVKSWRGIEDFGEDRLDWLRDYFPYKNEIPSHQTIGRIMSLLKPSVVLNAFIQFMSFLFKVSEEEIIALDGKTLRHSFDKSSGQKAIHILNAWAINAGVAIGQLKVDCKTNEITAVPELLELLNVKGATIVADALNTQKNIAEVIIENGANYALPVKGNHPKLEEDIILVFDTTKIDEKNNQIFLETIEKGHGRIETRQYSIISADVLVQKEEWKSLKNIGKIVSDVFQNGKQTIETRYFLLSFEGVEKFSSVVRGHWQIENSLHWVLDVTFGEDACRVRKDHAPENFSTIRKLALNLLRQETSTKLSIPRKQARASRKPDYLDKILQGSLKK